MKRLFVALTFVLALASPLKATEVVVSAAASLTAAFTEMKVSFEQAKPGTSVTLNFSNSGALFRQIEQGAPVDVFASADLKWMGEMLKAGLVAPGTDKLFAVNELVLAVPAANPGKVGTLADLKAEAVKRIAVGSPATVPAGNYTQVALTKSGDWNALEPKFVFAESVRQVLDYVSRGEVEAGFVYATDAKKAGEKVFVAAVVPLDEPVSYPIAPLAKAPHPEAAQAFVDFVLSSEGRKILASFGFSGPK